MAELKQYAYYIKGTKVAVVERDTTFDNDLNSKDFGPGSDRAQFKSPLSSVADALEIQYVHSPLYTINTTLKTNAITAYRTAASSSGNFLDISDTVSSYVNFDNILNVGDYFVLKNAGRFNGLHKIKEFVTVNSTNDTIRTWTKIPNLSHTFVDFEKEVFLYYSVDVLNDEDDVIDLPEYLCKALVDYVKAKLAEEALNIEVKEYFMREFRKKVEKFNNSRVSTMRLVVPGSHAIK